VNSHLDCNRVLPPPDLVEVSDRVYAYVQPDGSSWVNNPGFLVGSRGVVSIDTCATERRTHAYIDAIRSVTDLPVRTIVNTHHHGDHTFGNYLFPNATIVAHELTREAALAWGPPPMPFWTDIDWGPVELDPAFLTYTDSVTLWIDDLRVEVRHVGMAAHAVDDSIIWIPERELLFAGDLLFNGGTPLVSQGSVAGTVTVLEQVVKPLGARTIVPGHGGVCGPEAIDETLEYLRLVLNTARAGKAAGLTPLEAARDADLGPYAGLLEPERIVGNLYRAYAELDGAAPGEAIDFLGALSDAVAFNGGRPMTCLA
jgi:cyclase